MPKLLLFLPLGAVPPLLASVVSDAGWITEVARQTPSLLVLVALVYVGMRHFEKQLAVVDKVSDAMHKQNEQLARMEIVLDRLGDSIQDCDLRPRQ
jgi:hypothetical protein